MTDKQLIWTDKLFSSIGWAVPDNLSHEDWQQVGSKIKDANKTLGLIIGDWLNAYPGEWGKMYDEAREITGLSERRLQEFKQITESIKLRERSRNLSMQHHKQVIKFKDNPEKQVYWLDKAEKEGLSARVLSEAIKQSEVVETEKEAEKSNDGGIEEKDEFAERGGIKGYTEEEWDNKPDSYVGDCFKQCYEPRIMTRGDVFEYGIRGVYICSGCGYAYMPGGEPEKVNLEVYNEEIEKEEKEERENDVINNKMPDVSRINAKANNVWYTPCKYIESVKTVLGEIDLDPASSLEANEKIAAKMIYTEEMNGLSQEWRGSVWLNPPYGGQTSEFVSKLVTAYELGTVDEAILLINSNTTDTNWFQSLWDYTLCFTNHRINFYSPNNEEAKGSTHGSVFVYMGGDVRKFVTEFKQYGAVVRRVIND